MDHVTDRDVRQHRLDEDLRRLSDDLRRGPTARRRSADTTSPNRGRQGSAAAGNSDLSFILHLFPTALGID